VSTRRTICFTCLWLTLCPSDVIVSCTSCMLMSPSPSRSHIANATRIATHTMHTVSQSINQKFKVHSALQSTAVTVQRKLKIRKKEREKRCVCSLDLNVDSVVDDATSGGREFHVRESHTFWQLRDLTLLYLQFDFKCENCRIKWTSGKNNRVKQLMEDDKGRWRCFSPSCKMFHGRPCSSSVAVPWTAGLLEQWVQRSAA